MTQNTEKYALPWYRVFRSDGSIALKGEGKELQISLLSGVGVEVSEAGKMDLRKFGV